MSASWKWAAVVVALASCSARHGCLGRAAGGAQAACSRWANAYCGRLATCAPVSIEAEYGDLPVCVQRNEAGCLAALDAKGTGETAASLDACARSYPSATCEDVVVGRPPRECRVSGALPARTPCAVDAQCSSVKGPSYCRVAADERCGQCATLGGVGDGCDSDRDCQEGLVCYFTCMAPVSAGQPCDGMTRQCPQTLVCYDYQCVEPGRLGDACQPRADRCDHDHGFFCDPQTSRCADYKTAGPGAACGAGVLCRGGSCVGGDEGEPSRCVANAADGAACDPVRGPSCTAPARCVANVCRQPDATACR
jgi:hypothetical protein